MKERSLKQFNPIEIAKFETKMWQAYYSHRFLKLFFIFIEIIHKHFNINYFTALRASYFLAVSAVDFRINRGKENEKRIIKNLTKFYKIVNKHSLEKFNYEKFSELQLKLWLVDRYPDRYSVSRREILAEEAGFLYSIDSNKLKDYAHFRANAMELYDKAEGDVDWNEVEQNLVKSFTELQKAVNG